MAHEKFEKVFRDRLRALEENAHAVGINMTTVCHEAHVGRATPDRWKRQTPKTVALIDAMERVVDKHRAKLLKELELKK